MTHRELGRHQVWTEYRSRAHKRKIDWKLDPDDFFQLLGSPCHYCGSGPGRVIWPRGIDRRWIDEDELFICGGIDRKSSHGPYDAENSLPCCTLCNMAKRDVEYQAFRDWIVRVYRNLHAEI